MVDKHDDIDRTGVLDLRRVPDYTAWLLGSVVCDEQANWTLNAGWSDEASDTMAEPHRPDGDPGITNQPLTPLHPWLTKNTGISNVEKRPVLVIIYIAATFHERDATLVVVGGK